MIKLNNKIMISVSTFLIKTKNIYLILKQTIFIFIVLTVISFNINCKKYISKNDNNRLKYSNMCDSIYKINQLIQEVINKDYIYMSSLNDTAKIDYLLINDNFNINKEFKVEFNSRNVITLHSKIIDSLKGDIIYFKEIYFNNELTRASVKVDYYSNSSLTKSTSLDLKLDTNNCSWNMLDSAIIVY